MDRSQLSSSRELDASFPSVHTVTRLKSGKPAQIDVQPFSHFQAVKSPQSNTSSPVRRKPLPASATQSPLVAKFPLGKVVTAEKNESKKQTNVAQVDDEPIVGHRPPWLPPPSSSPTIVARDLDQFPRGHSPNIPQSPGLTPFSDLSADKARQILQNLDRNGQAPMTYNHNRIVSDPPIHDPPPEKGRPGAQRSTTMPSRGENAPPLQHNGDVRSSPPRKKGSNEPVLQARPSISLAPNMLSSFFGWKASAQSPIAETSPTTISDRSHSPGPSPRGPSPSSFPSSVKSIPQAIDIPKANGPLPSSYYTAAGHPHPPPTPAMSIQIEEMEEELREVSGELAASIRREMELEDEIERLRLDGPTAPDLNRRTSDYFSDSGTSSIRYPLSENGGTKLEDMEKAKRRSEQEKAQLKLDVSQKLQEERILRKAMKAQIKSLEEHVQNVERNQSRTASDPSRIQDLEGALEDTRRKLQEERQLKDSCEDLLTALRGEIEQHQNERDNLRDEVVPQLRARVEGLEADATEFQKLQYENTRMQQELQSLRSENSFARSPRFPSIAEEGDRSPSSPLIKTGLTRSTSLVRGNSSAAGLVRSGSLSRSNSVSKERESRESLADRVKEIELQRDALHRALRSLLDRQKYQTIEHEKRIRNLELERDRAIDNHSPRRRGYEKEVKGLRLEINELRKRTDEALEQKWQCEKGLGGLKKDLDRAEQETGSLRHLLRENDILIPDVNGRLSDVGSEPQVTSSSLEEAYQRLQATQSLSLSRLQKLGRMTPSNADDAKTGETMDILLKSFSEVEAAQENKALADELHASASRVEELASLVRYQLEANSGLRVRLAQAVERGEKEQKVSATRINNMQGKLKSLEDRLMAAQQHSEEAVQMREEEVKEMHDSHNSQLQRRRGTSPRPDLSPRPGLSPRLGTSPRSSTPSFLATSNMGLKLSPRMPQSPMFFGPRSPRLDKTSTGVGMSMNEALRTEFLERRVAELENALAEADREMHEVVQRMNQAQIEVLELQSARDDAMRQTKKLQMQILAESEKVGSLMRFLPI